MLVPKLPRAWCLTGSCLLLRSVDRGHPSAYPGHGSGMANSAYHRDSYLGPIDKYAPPPYGAPPNGMGSGEMTPPSYARGHWHGPGAVYLARSYPYAPGDGAAPTDAY